MHSNIKELLPNIISKNLITQIYRPSAEKITAHDKTS